ncbi:MAG: T9SS C-terminal target domain-containing protein, partial [Bacteroidetes bacterium]
GASWNTIGEPAALNESFSDILGAMAEFYVKSNYSTNTSFSYSHGIESLTNTFFSLGPCNNVSFLASNIRNMADPNATGHPDTYLQSNLWIPTTCTTADNGGRHTNAQVQNHWFFILAEGETGVNANNDAYCVPGIGKTKATAITFRNLTVYMNANSDYAAARVGSIQSAIDLFGANSDEVAQVTQAWFAVGVGARYLGTIDVKNITVTNTQNFNRNCRIEVQNFTNQGTSSDVTITSNTEIAFLADVNVNNGSTLNAFIAPTCNGNSAFVSNSNQPVEKDTKSTKQESKNENPVLQSNEDIMESKTSNPNFNVVPNPTTGIFTLMLDNNLITPELIVVSNMLGEVVFEKEILLKEEIEFDLSTNPNGIYFIKVVNKGGTYSTKKVIKY